MFKQVYKSHGLQISRMEFRIFIMDLPEYIIDFAYFLFALFS